MTNIPLKYWKQFVASQKIYKTKVPLFKSDAELRVQTKKIGTTRIRYVLQRSEANELILFVPLHPLPRQFLRVRSLS